MSLARISQGSNRKGPGHASIVEKGWIRISNIAHTVGGKFSFYDLKNHENMKGVKHERKVISCFPHFRAFVINLLSLR